MAERTNAKLLKSFGPKAPWVRIPLPPPVISRKAKLLNSARRILMGCQLSEISQQLKGSSDFNGVRSSDHLRARDCCLPGIDPIRSSSLEVVNVAGLSCWA